MAHTISTGNRRSASPCTELSQTRTPDELYRSIYRASSRALEFEGFYVSLLEPGRDLARIVFAVERGEEYPSDIVYRGSHSEVIRTGRGLVVLLQDAANDGSAFARKRIELLAHFEKPAAASQAFHSHDAAEDLVRIGVLVGIPL